MSAAGNHILVSPAGLSTSARVVTSNMRQPSDGGCCEKESSDFKKVRPTNVRLVDRKKSRRFMNYPHIAWRLVDYDDRCYFATRRQPLFLYSDPRTNNYTPQQDAENT